MMNELALFAGIGGGILGGQLLGWKTVCAIEIDPFCREVLIRRQLDGFLPKFPIWDDIQTFDGKPWKGKIGIITGGFPCQDISCAGTGKGIEGARSGLWSEMARVVREVRSPYVFVENSPMLTTRGLGTVLKDLAEMGYDARWGIFSACAVGAPHSRERLFLVGYSSRHKYISDEDENKINNKNGTTAWMDAELFRGGFDNKLKKLPPASRVNRMDDGSPDRLDRTKGLGNAQVPAVVRLAWSTLSDGIT